MKTSFKTGAASANESATAVAEQEAPATETNDTTVAVRADSTVALPGAQGSDMGGEWNRDDVRLPRVNLVHKTSDSELINKFGIGGFVLNKEVKLSDGKTPGVEIYVVRALKDYVQKLPFGDPETPTVYKTEAEVVAGGGSLQYKDYENGNFFQPRAHVQLVVGLPEGASEADEALFPYEFDGKAYAMAMLTVASSAYTSVGKELATLRNNNKVMRKGLFFGRLNLFSEVRKGSKNSWHVPVIKFAGENSPEFAAYLQSLL